MQEKLNETLDRRQVAEKLVNERQNQLVNQTKIVKESEVKI